MVKENKVFYLVLHEPTWPPLHLKDTFHKGQDPILFILVLPLPNIAHGT